MQLDDAMQSNETLVMQLGGLNKTLDEEMMTEGLRTVHVFESEGRIGRPPASERIRKMIYEILGEGVKTSCVNGVVNAVLRLVDVRLDRPLTTSLCTRAAQEQAILTKVQLAQVWMGSDDPFNVISAGDGTTSRHAVFQVQHSGRNIVNETWSSFHTLWRPTPYLGLETLGNSELN